MARVRPPLLVGRSPSRTRRYLGIAGGIFVGTLGMIGLVWVLGQLRVSVPVSRAWLVGPIALFTVGVPTLQAYRNDGLLVSLALGLSTPLAFYLALTTRALVFPRADAVWSAEMALWIGVQAGVLGFVLGAGIRRVRTWLLSDESPTVS